MSSDLNSVNANSSYNGFLTVLHAVHELLRSIVFELRAYHCCSRARLPSDRINYLFIVSASGVAMGGLVGARVQNILRSLPNQWT